MVVVAAAVQAVSEVAAIVGAVVTAAVVAVAALPIKAAKGGGEGKRTNTA